MYVGYDKSFTSLFFGSIISYYVLMFVLYFPEKWVYVAFTRMSLNMHQKPLSGTSFTTVISSLMATIWHIFCMMNVQASMLTLGATMTNMQISSKSFLKGKLIYFIIVLLHTV